MKNKKYEIEDGKNLAIVAYLTLIGTLVAYFLNKDKNNAFTLFHVKQGFGLGISYMVLGFVASSFDSFAISIGFWICFGVLYFYGMMGAAAGKYLKIPVLGELYQKLFQNLV